MSKRDNDKNLDEGISTCFDTIFDWNRHTAHVRYNGVVIANLKLITNDIEVNLALVKKVSKMYQNIMSNMRQ